MRVTRLFSATLTICAAVFAAAVTVNAAGPAGPSPYEDVLTRARNFCGDGAGTAEDGNDEGMTGIIEAAGKTDACRMSRKNRLCRQGYKWRRDAGMPHRKN